LDVFSEGQEIFGQTRSNVLLTLKLPKLVAGMTDAKIEKVFVGEGQFLMPGTKFCDLRIDLSAVAAHDCPPVSFFRIVFRDRAWVRQLDVASGDTRIVDAELALFSTVQDEAVNSTAARSARFSTAGIIYHSNWWDEMKV
jgi:hypothetical protein